MSKIHFTRLMLNDRVLHQVGPQESSQEIQVAVAYCIASWLAKTRRSTLRPRSQVLSLHTTVFRVVAEGKR